MSFSISAQTTWEYRQIRQILGEQHTKDLTVDPSALYFTEALVLHKSP
jgi:hypothetical protein